MGRTQDRSRDRGRDRAPGAYLRQHPAVAPATDFPGLGAQGLVAKINADAPLLARSRLPALERALSEELIPAKQEIVRDTTESEFNELNMRTRGLLESRLAGLREQLSN